MAEPRVVTHAPSDAAAPEVSRPVTPWRRLWDSATLRKTAIIVLLAVLWEAYARVLDNPLLFPTLSDTLGAVVDHIRTAVCRRGPGRRCGSCCWATAAASGSPRS